MKPMGNELHAVYGIDEQRETRPVAMGYFTIKPSAGRVTLELKGEFTRDTIKGISNAISSSKAFKRKYFELDMNRVASIDMQAMSLLLLPHKTSSDRGTKPSLSDSMAERPAWCMQWACSEPAGCGSAIDLFVSRSAMRKNKNAADAEGPEYLTGSRSHHNVSSGSGWTGKVSCAVVLCLRWEAW